MIRVTVELDKFGLGTEIKNLGSIEIGNDGTGNSEIGNYNVLICDPQGREVGFARVEDFERKYGWESLLLHALAELEEVPLG